MAVEIEVIDFSVPISVIREKHPGGWEQCLIENDDYLFRNDEIYSYDIEEKLEYWNEIGFYTHEGGDNPTK